MRFSTRMLLLAALLIPLAAVAGNAELDVERYIELTIARLELVEASWRETGEPPPQSEIEELYPAHGTDQETYLCFAGEKKEEIDAYLEEHPELQATIESLSASIRSQIEQAE